MNLLLRKLYLYFTKDPEGRGGGGGCPTFSRGGGGPNANFYIKKNHIRTCYFPGGCPDPYPPLDPHMGNVIIHGTIFVTAPLLTMIVRH